MGQITNENGKPAVGAEIKVTGHKVYYKMKTDNDGLYYTPLIDATSYHVIIDANGKYYTTDKIKISKPGEVKEFYNFTLSGKDAVLHIDEGKDQFMIARMEKIEADLRIVADTTAPLKLTKKMEAEPEQQGTAPEKKEENTPRRRRNNTSVKIIPGEKVPQSDK